MDFPATMAWLERHKELSMDREWIYELDEKGNRIFQVYVRTSVRPFRRPPNNDIAFHYTLEIANIQTGNGESDTGKGYFTAWLNAVMEKAETQFHAIFIENVIEQRFRLFFISRGFKNPGYTDDFAPPSFFKLLKFEDGIEYGEGGGQRMWEKIAQRREVA